MFAAQFVGSSAWGCSLQDEKLKKFKLQELVNVYNQNQSQEFSALSGKVNCPSQQSPDDRESTGATEMKFEFHFAGDETQRFLPLDHALKLLANPCLQTMPAQDKRTAMEAASELSKWPSFKLGMNFSPSGSVQYFVYSTSEMKNCIIFELPAWLLKYCEQKKCYSMLTELINFVVGRRAKIDIPDYQIYNNEREKFYAKKVLMGPVLTVYNWNYSGIIGNFSEKADADKRICDIYEQHFALVQLRTILRNVCGSYATFEPTEDGGIAFTDRHWTNRNMNKSPSIILTKDHVDLLYFVYFDPSFKNEVYETSLFVPEPVKKLLKLSPKFCCHDVLYSYPAKKLEDVEYCSNYPSLDVILKEQLKVKVDTPSWMQNLEKYDFVLNEFLRAMLVMKNCNAQIPAEYKFEVTRGAKSCIRVTHNPSNKLYYLPYPVFNKIFPALISNDQNIQDHLTLVGSIQVINSRKGLMQCEKTCCDSPDSKKKEINCRNFALYVVQLAISNLYWHVLCSASSPSQPKQTSSTVAVWWTLVEGDG
eukprot:GHVT01093445.1.p1 GENE.GHVT01093445.1~~GHVT01093445.1.p1  ORF type:complete len:534 (-),score=32.66 GHVT01093445.1:1128-2729(-)